MSCVVEDVNAPDGTRSTLFDQLLQVTASDREAMELYLNVMAEPLNEELIKDNGEPELGDVIHRDDLGFTEKHRGLYSTKDYSTSTRESSAIQGIKSRLISEQKAIRNRLAGEIGASEREILTERLNQLRERAQELENRPNIRVVREIASEHIDWMRDLLSSPRSLSFNELLLGIQIADSWDYDNTQEYLTEPQIQNNDEFNQLFLDVDNEIRQLRNSLMGHAWQRILDDINQELDQPEGEQLTVEDIKEMPSEQVSSFILNTSNYFDLSTEDQRLIQRFDELLKLAKRNQAININKIDSRLEELAEPVEDTSVLLQRDEDGNPTGGLVNPHSAEFYERRDKAMNVLEQAQKSARGGSMSDGKRAKRQFTSALRDIGEAVDIRYLVDELDTPLEYSSEEEYRNHLEDRVGEAEAERAIRSALEAWEEYKSRRSAFREVVESELQNGRHRDDNLTREEYLEERMQDFRRRESPIVFLQEFHQDVDPTVFNDGWQYSYIAADPEYQDNQWDALNEDQERLAEYLRNLYSNLFNLLPDHVSRRADANFLPRVEKDVIERYQDDGIRAAFKQMGEEWFESVTGDELQTLTDGKSLLPNQFSGYGTREQIPLRFVSDNVDLQDRSKNIIRITEMFAKMAINYNFMLQNEPQLQLMARLVEEQVDNPEDSSLLESVEYNIDALMYEERRSRQEGPAESFVTSYNPTQAIEDKQRQKEIEREYRELEEKWKNREITREEFRSEEQRLEEEYASLKGKTISPMRVVESTVGRFTMLSSMGYNVQAGIANGLFGIMAMSVHAAGEQDFTAKEFRQAFMTYFNLRLSGSGKAGNLMKNMDILHEISEIAYGEGKATEAERREFIRKVTDSPYFLMRDTESMIQSITMMAVMMNEKVEVETENGTEEISVWEGFKEDGTWNTERFGEKPEFNPPEGASEKNRWTNLRDKIVQLNKRLHGNYDVNSPMDVKKLPLGRLLMMFRSWIPEGFRYRFGSHRWDAQLGRHVKGSYRSVWDIGTEHGFTTVPKSMFNLLLDSDWKGENTDIPIDDIDIIGMKKVMKDMQWFLAMGAIMLSLQQIIDDDEEDDFSDMAARSTINTIFRVRQDITFYLSPLTAVNILQNPIPALRSVVDGMRAMDSVRRSIMDPDYQGSPAYQMGDAMTPSKQITDLFILLHNIEEEGEFSTKVNE